MVGSGHVCVCLFDVCTKDGVISLGVIILALDSLENERSGRSYSVAGSCGISTSEAGGTDVAFVSFGSAGGGVVEALRRLGSEPDKRVGVVEEEREESFPLGESFKEKDNFPADERWRGLGLISVSLLGICLGSERRAARGLVETISGTGSALGMLGGESGGLSGIGGGVGHSLFGSWGINLGVIGFCWMT